MKEWLSILFILVLQSLLFAEEPKGTLQIQSEIEGLMIEIDEIPRGVSEKNGVQTFEVEGDVGTGGFGFHKVVLHKEINATHEYYAEKEFKYKPFEPIIITEKKLLPRLKRALLAKQNDLLYTIPLQHQYASHIAVDEPYIYVLSQSRTKVYSTHKKESNDAEYLEIYDTQTRSFVKQIVLNEEANDSYDRDIVVHQGFVYVSSKNGEVIFWEKENLLTQSPRKLLSPIKGLAKLRSFGNFLFRFGKNGFVEIYQNNLHVKTIDIKQHRFKGYEALEDKRFDTIFDVLYTNEKLFIANDLGEIQVYSFRPNSKESTFIAHLRDPKRNDAYDVLALALYGRTTVVVGSDTQGLYAYDTQTLQPLFHTKTFAPNATNANVYRMDILNDVALLTQGLDTPHLYAYDMKRHKIIHDFQGEAKAVMDFCVSHQKVYSIDDGHLYVWDLK